MAALRGSGMSAYAWLYGIARDCLIDAWRRETREGARPTHREMPWPEQSSVQLGLSLAGTGTTPTEAVVREELRQQICRALDMLARPTEKILWIRDVDSISFRDVAARSEDLGSGGDEAILAGEPALFETCGLIPGRRRDWGTGNERNDFQ